MSRDASVTEAETTDPGLAAVGRLTRALSNHMGHQLSVIETCCHMMCSDLPPELRPFLAKLSESARELCGLIEALRTLSIGAAPAGRTGGLTLLLLEPHAARRQAWRCLLEGLGHRVLCAEDEAAARAAAERSRRRPDALLAHGAGGDALASELECPRLVPAGTWPLPGLVAAIEGLGQPAGA